MPDIGSKTDSWNSYDKSQRHEYEWLIVEIELFEYGFYSSQFLSKQVVPIACRMNVFIRRETELVFDSNPVIDENCLLMIILGISSHLNVQSVYVINESIT